MNDVPSTSISPPQSRRGGLVRAAVVFASIMAAYLIVAYGVMPLFWKTYVHRHPAIDSVPGITQTGDGHPGDPINIGLIGSEEDLNRIMLKAGWYPADPITLKSCLKIAAGTIFKRPYDDAPVSPLYLRGKKQQLAFEQPVGDNPRQRNHVRFWQSPELDDQKRPLWSGSATYDERVGLSHTTGEVTHHIAPDVDAERDHLLKDLGSTGNLVDIEVLPDFHKVRTGRNGGGDPWRTDGSLVVGTIRFTKP
jgi:hypothetical protein